jgi:hypothetical protein
MQHTDSRYSKTRIAVPNGTPSERLFPLRKSRPAGSTLGHMNSGFALLCGNADGMISMRFLPKTNICGGSKYSGADQRVF